MHSVTLTCHPDTPSGAETAISAIVERAPAGLLEIRYDVRGAVEAVQWPAKAKPTRADGLWAHTCFEAFVRAAEDETYSEFNFAPSTQWAAYAFSGYRAGMQLADSARPAIKTERTAGRFILRVRLFLPEWRGCALRLGLSTVIEDTDGVKSYWALAHPPGKPDFHHSDGFALLLPAELP